MELRGSEKRGSVKITFFQSEKGSGFGQPHDSITILQWNSRYTSSWIFENASAIKWSSSVKQFYFRPNSIEKYSWYKNYLSLQQFLFPTLLLTFRLRFSVIFPSLEWFLSLSDAENLPFGQTIRLDIYLFIYLFILITFSLVIQSL